MSNRVRRIGRAPVLLMSTFLAAHLLSACGGSSDDSSAPPTAAAGLAPGSEETAPAEGSVAQAKSASLSWPQGTDDFTLSVCVSIGANTIQGAGDSTSGKWSLSFDANLLQPDDTGTLAVSQASDKVIVYNAAITSLTVKDDGSFAGTGEDLGGVPFEITGTCDVTR